MDDYIVSARKYRPMTFDSVVGQHALTTTLKNTVKSGKLAHAYLFCGPRGVGKTTCARIFAKAINCENPSADGEACNECESCRSFNEQRSLNIFELDAASNNSVENIKQLMEQTRIPPQTGSYKVFIIDEVHMLSSQAFNAFLKTLEEPPAHVIFILATTEKQKILPTILSRCQIYDFERMTVANTVNHLKYVADKEGLKYEEEALGVIAEKADGGMRDALSIFDQAASFCQGDITYAKVIEDLNVLDSDNYFKVVELSLENKVPEVMVLLNDVINKGFDGGNFINGLAKHVRNVLMAKDASTLPLLEVSERTRSRYQEQAKKCPIPFLYKSLQILNTCDINYRQSRNKRLLVEISLIQVAQATQDDDDAGAGRRPTQILKPIFKQLLSNSNNSPANVMKAVTVRNATRTLPTQHPIGSNGSSAPTEKSTNVPKLKLSSLGISLKELNKKSEGNEGNVPDKGFAADTIVAEAAATSKKPSTANKEFTQSELETCWLDICNRMPRDYAAIAGRMKSMRPTITAMPAIELTLESEFALNDMKKIESRLVASLVKYLGNTEITLTLHLAVQGEHKKVLTRAEQFMEMGKKHPPLLKLTENLGLELS